MPYNVIDLNTPMQAVALQVQPHTTVTKNNVDSPGSQNLNYLFIKDIDTQLP